MKSSRPLSLALIASAAIAWTVPALAAGDCSTGKTKYIANCAVCHGNTPNAAARLGSNPNVIFAQMTDSSARGYNSMNFLYPGTVNDADIYDISEYLFYYPSSCPVLSPSLSAVPAPVAFGSTMVGSTSTSVAVTVRNNGTAIASAIGFSNSNGGEFVVSGSNNCTSQPVAAGGGTCGFSVAFKPSAAGARSGTLTLSYNSKTLLIGMSGTGSAVATPGQLSMSSSISFGGQTVDTTSAAISKTVTNTGGTAVVVSSLSSSNPSEFAVTSSSCGTVNAGAACTFSVTFKPGAAGSRTGSISLVSNGTGSPQAVNVSGTGTTVSAAATVTVVEYRNSGFDHYFITPVAAEITLLDAGAPPFQAWTRTGFSFKAYVNATAPANSVAICRFFNSTFAPKSSHFYAPHGLGCEATIASFPDWGLEDDKLFNSMLPDANGACPSGTIPVYRLYNNGMGGAPNHRFVTDLTERQRMLTTGFVAEGAGIGVGMCVPP